VGGRRAERKRKRKRGQQVPRDGILHRIVPPLFDAPGRRAVFPPAGLAMPADARPWAVMARIGQPSFRLAFSARGDEAHWHKMNHTMSFPASLPPC
jgi:hypothetical protein